MKKSQLFKPKQGLSGSKSFNGRKQIDDLYKNAEWAEYSKKFLSYNSKCYSCGERSEAVDHIEPHKGRENIFWKLDNMIPLCHKCHNFVTSKFDRYWKIGNSVVPKIKWMAENRAIKNLNFRVKVVPKGMSGHTGDISEILVNK